MFETKRLSQIGLLTGLGAVLPAVGTAEAAPVCATFPCAFTVTSSPDEVNDPGESQDNDPKSTTVTFNKFDPSLGTLTEIDFSLTSTLFGFFATSGFNSSNEGQSPASGQTLWSAAFSLTLPGIAEFTGTKTDTVSCSSTTGFCSNSKSPSFSLTWNDEATQQSVLNLYTGPGTLDATFNLDLTLTEINEAAPPSSASGGGSATWDPPTVDGLTVTYIFTPNATVPEPGTLALLGMGAMAGLGFARRRVKPDG